MPRHPTDISDSYHDRTTTSLAPEPTPSLALAAAFGLDDVAASVFAAAVQRPCADLATVADLAGRSLRQTHIEIAWLQERGLLREIDGIWAPPHPRRVPRAQQARQDAAIAAHWTAALARHAEHLRAAILAGTELTGSLPSDDVELLHPHEAHARVARLLDTARSHVHFLLCGPTLPQDHSEHLIHALLRAAGRGVAITSVWTPDFLAAACARTAGEQLRTADWIRQSPDVPMRMLVVDRQTALLPIDATDLAQGALAFRTPALRQLVTNLIEQIHRDATPPPPRTNPANRHAEVLALLNEGLTEDAIAARLHVHVRTVSRTIANLRNELNVSTPFQLGAAAHQHGLIPRPRPTEPERRNQPAS
ncbi:helix-turn-helix domain-containing protein [Pseudofrankia sp. DC12]|uniref:helix-turn-helix transcriptional regulator n=1 Tax=Pseudofrankia sp. DC12 TaxID=683315 RepID=UPI0006989264|nr:helix-turn-helix domain-containing protein [Pseudofrankia sp. DC12]